MNKIFSVVAVMLTLIFCANTLKDSSNSVILDPYLGKWRSELTGDTIQIINDGDDYYLLTSEQHVWWLSRTIYSSTEEDMGAYSTHDGNTRTIYMIPLENINGRHCIYLHHTYHRCWRVE